MQVLRDAPALLAAPLLTCSSSSDPAPAPVLTVETAAAVTKRSVQAANVALAALEKAAVVKTTSAAKRNRLFEAPELLLLVSAFERDLASSKG